jgi:hypothetical protein
MAAKRPRRNVPVVKGLAAKRPIPLLDSGANRVFVGSAGWRKLRALGFQLHSTGVDDCTGVDSCTLASASKISCIGAVNVPVTLE